jgi:hypothetical protein
MEIILYLALSFRDTPLRAYRGYAIAESRVHHLCIPGAALQAVPE